MAHADYGMLSAGRGGFTLVEILVVLAIGIVLAVAVLPSVIGAMDQSRVEQSAKSFHAIGEAIGSMWGDVEQYPGSLSDLSGPLGATDLCGNAYANPGDWTGPYLSRTVPATGLPLPIGTANNTLTYTEVVPPDPNPEYMLWVTVEGASHEDALALNAEVDDDGGDSAAGAIRWGAPTDGVVDLSYVRPVQPC